MRYDAVIVGAGPAGAACALVLARAGARVAIVERAAFPRRKVCGEYLNPGAVAQLADLDLASVVAARARPVRGIRLLARGAPAVELGFDRPAYALARSELDAIVLDAARAAGAQVIAGRADDVVVERGRATAVAVGNGDERIAIEGRTIVGADGAGSIVARKLGLALPPRGPRRFAIGGHYAGFGDDDSVVEMYVGGGAYFAINPLSREIANVMVVVRESELASWSQAVDGGVAGKAAELGRGRRSFAGARRVGTRAAIGPLAFSVREPVAPGAVLVGDAAGFVNPFTGQGVYLALRSGRAAAAAILTAIGDERREAEAFAAYRRTREREFGERRRLAALVGTLVDVPALARRAARRLERTPQLAAPLMAAVGGSAPLSPFVLARLLA